MLKSKTIAFSILLAALGAVELQMHLIQGYLGEYYGVAYIAIAVIVATLRVVTTQALSDK